MDAPLDFSALVTVLRSDVEEVHQQSFPLESAANCSACPEGWVGEMYLCYGRGGSGSRKLQAVGISVCSEEWVGEMSCCLELLDKEITAS